MDYVLQIGNVYSYLLTSDLELKTRLWTAMRFREKGYFFTPQYRQRIWDGYVEFFDKKGGRFLTGLLTEVEWALKHKFKVQYSINDVREPFYFKYESVNNQFLPGVTLYDYQVDLINQAIKHKRGIVKAPTGSGKTNILVGIIKALPPDTPALILQDTLDLTEQNHDNLAKFGFDVGIFHGKKQQSKLITCCTIQSVKKLEQEFHKFKVLIVDEVHAAMSPVPIRIYKKLKFTPVKVAISATPFINKTQKFKTRGYFGAVFQTKATESGELSTSELQERGILSGSNCTFFEINEPQLPYEVYQDAVKFGISENHHLHLMVKKLVKSVKGRTLILVERLIQGDTLASMIPGSFWIQGKDDIDDRKLVIEKLKTSENCVAIVSQKIISKGLDVKIHNLINAAGGLAEHSIIQRMGRGLRTAEDKDILLYYDFLFNINDYLRDHSEERIKCLKKEGHSVTVKEEIDI